ncbi:aspartic peptidase domain-containing protein, partial [Xylariales sp. AK1849]
MSLLKVALAFSLLSLSNAKTNLSLKVKDPAGVLSIPLKRVDRPVEAATSVQRRYFRTGLLDIIGAAYLAERTDVLSFKGLVFPYANLWTVTIGTGSTDQVVEVLLDTGSFELWVNPNCTSSNVPYYCNQFGHYDPTLSPTAHTLNETFQITYGSGSTSGVYYTDDIFISGAGLDNQQFGVAITSDQVWFGIMGLSRGLGNGFIDYNTIVDTLLAQSFTNSRLFSLDLGSQGPPQVAITGEIVFGGVDKNKYSGNLAKVPTDPSDAHYTVILTSLAHKPPTAQTSTTITNTPISLIVDSGTTLSLLPENVVDALAGQFPGALSDGQGGYKVPCAYQSQPGTVDFSFGNVRISVPYSEFIWNSGTTENCFLGAWNNPAVDVYILGDTFLRGAYVVFDQDSRALYMGNYINCGDSSLAPVP